MDKLKLSNTDQILKGMPDSCRPCPVAISKADELAYWVNDGRLKPARASELLLELVGCGRNSSEQLPGLQELAPAD